LGDLEAEAAAAHDEIWRVASLGSQGTVLAYQGQAAAARAAAEATLEAGAELGGVLVGMGYHVLALAALAAGDGAGAQEAREAASKHISVVGEMGAMWRYWDAEAALAGGDLAAARGWADDAVSATKGCYLSWALTGRARVLMAQGESKQAESDAHDALTRAAKIEAYIGVPDILEVLADLAGEAGGYREAARLFGAAQAIRQRIGVVRFMVYEAGYQASVTALRDAMGEKDFDAAWAEGAALSTEEAIVYAQRGHGERNRPANGWASLTAPSATWCDWSPKGSRTTTSPQGFSSHRAPCKHTSPTSTTNSASPPAYNSRKKQRTTPDPSGRSIADTVSKRDHI